MLGHFDTLGQCADPGIDRVSLRLELLALFPELAEGDEKYFYELVLLQLGLELLVLRQAHVDCDVHHPQVRVAEPGI